MKKRNNPQDRYEVRVRFIGGTNELFTTLDRAPSGFYEPDDSGPWAGYTWYDICAQTRQLPGSVAVALCDRQTRSIIAKEVF